MLPIAAIVFFAGCFGGLVNAAIAGSLQLPKTDQAAGVWKPGWVGNVLVGATAAVVFWGLYGGLADAGLLSNSESSTPIIEIKMRELAGAVLSGVGGGRILTNEVDKRLLDRERSELASAKGSLVASLRELATT